MIVSSASAKTSSSRLRRASARRRRGASIQAPNLAEAYRVRAVGLDPQSHEYLAYTTIAERLDSAGREIPQLAQREVAAHPDELPQLLLRERDEARRAYEEESRRGPSSELAMRKRLALEDLEAALSRAATVDEQQKRDATRKPRRQQKGPGNQAQAPNARPDGRSDLRNVGRRAGRAHQRSVYDQAGFDLNGGVDAIKRQARRAPPEQLEDVLETLRANRGTNGRSADLQLAELEAAVSHERLRKKMAEQRADRHLRGKYGVTAGQLLEREGMPDRFTHEADNSERAMEEADRVVRERNSAPKPQAQVRQKEEPPPIDEVPAHAAVGRPPSRFRGVRAGSRRDRIAAQSQIARQRQDRLRQPVA